MPFKGVAPASKLKAKPYGLFSVADVSERGPRDEHWGQGFDALTEACSFDVSLVDMCGITAEEKAHEANGERSTYVRPFGIVARDTCLTVGTTPAERKTRVLRQLDLVTQKAVELEFWAGPSRRAWDQELEDQQPGSSVPLGYLSSSDTTDVTAGNAVKPLIGLALLEQAFADGGPGIQGTVHMSPLVGEMLTKHLKCVDGVLYTKSGNKVAIGSGYTGVGPGNATDPDSPFVHWMYITGQVTVVLGTEELVTTSAAQAVNVRNNEATYAAERPAAVYTDGCNQYAAKVDIRL